MKLLFKLIILIGIFTFSQNSNAQFFKKLAEKAEKKIEKEAESRTEKRMNEKIDEGFDEVEDKIDGKDKKEKGDEKISGEEKEETTTSNEEIITNKKTTPTVVWSKFDFVPGDTVIFEDMPSMDEENGEFPSRWDLYKGGAEIVTFNGENVINFTETSSNGIILPYLKNSNEDYLPEVFTIELDIWFEKSSTTANRYYIHLKDQKNQHRSSNMNDWIVVYPNGIEFLETDKRYPGTEDNNWSEEPIGQWRHISIAYTKGKFKVYMDDTRLINVPHYEKNPTGLTLSGLSQQMYVKNIRIAKGGVKYYERVLSEGKIIVNGIKFDVNKATLKAESMGPINKIYQLMEKKPELNFSVEGHTDSDGGDETNMILSKARGKSVMDKLIAMGINKDRLKSNGFGESKPIDNNSTPEGKANNRRVEFVKF